MENQFHCFLMLWFIISLRSFYFRNGEIGVSNCYNCSHNGTYSPLLRAQVIPWLKTAIRGRTIRRSYLNKQFVLKALTPHTHPHWPLFGNTWGKHHSLSRNSNVAGALFWFVPVVFCHLEWSCHGLVHQVKSSQSLPCFYFSRWLEKRRAQVLLRLWKRFQGMVLASSSFQCSHFSCVSNCWTFSISKLCSTRRRDSDIDVRWLEKHRAPAILWLWKASQGMDRSSSSIQCWHFSCVRIYWMFSISQLSSPTCAREDEPKIR